MFVRLWAMAHLSFMVLVLALSLGSTFANSPAPSPSLALAKPPTVPHSTPTVPHASFCSNFNTNYVSYFPNSVSKSIATNPIAVSKGHSSTTSTLSLSFSFSLRTFYSVTNHSSPINRNSTNRCVCSTLHLKLLFQTDLPSLGP